MTDLCKLAEAATLREANALRQKEWDTAGQITLAYRGNELAGEVDEACNVIKKLERERMGIQGSRDTNEHLAEELADIVICTDLIAMDAGIDLDAAVEAKFNSTSEKVGLRTRLALTAKDAEIAALKEKVKRQAEALRPFAVVGAYCLDNRVMTESTWLRLGMRTKFIEAQGSLTHGNFRRAAQEASK